MVENNSYRIKFTDKTEMSITPEQYEAFLEESTTNKPGMKINGNYITFKSIYSATGEYVKPFHELDHKALPSATKSSNYELWIEATKRNRDRMKQGITPVAYWRVTRDGELIEDPKYYDTVLQGGV